MEFIHFIYWLNGWIEISYTNLLYFNETKVILEHINKVKTNSPHEKVILFMLKLQIEKYYEKCILKDEEGEMFKYQMVVEHSKDILDLMKEIINQYLTYVPNHLNQKLINLTLDNSIALDLSNYFGNKKIC